MNESSIFLGCLIVLLVFNVFYASIIPEAMFSITYGGIMGLLLFFIPLAIIAGFNGLTFGENTMGTKFIIGLPLIAIIMFQVSIPTLLFSGTWISGTVSAIAPTGNIPIGFGLVTNLFSAFAIGDLFGIGLFISIIITFLMLITGVLMILHSGSGD